MRIRWLLATAGFLATPVVYWCFATAVGLALDRDLREWARHDAAHELTRSVFAAVELYHRDHQRVPSRNEGLAALTPSYVARIPRDPWRRDLLYNTQRGDWADVISLGRDGQPGGYRLDTDISARYGSPGTSAPRTLNLVLIALLAALPVAAFVGTLVSPPAQSALAGIALFWAWLVSVTIAPDAAASLALLGSFAAVVCGLTGALLCARQRGGGPVCALAGTLACQLACVWIIGTIA